ncbi:PREDICTED: N-alpha-acetyltransferase 35, NatC auxiliary subunit-like [Priapulus caudatus]|uniref:Protein MAK10 homolog n=1 Tax=Priapulus caudatus TaxID=37621 RepID=A0ABM1EQH1_PRICU|nr:PREDICTED: N-alpha-acetyltransferase 35, NatC auxiliary subunit-like [Priapulus caudatus]
MAMEMQHNWVDVTDTFRTSCTELKLGELVHDQYFGLFEAMSAIEMMDPKMDAGMLCHQSHLVMGFDKSINAGKLKKRNVLMPELIAIIDDTYACLVTWLEGHSLAQTLFTNLYLHKVHDVDDRQVKAFSIAMLKIVDILREIVSRASVFEEEDFQPLTYGFKMAADISEVRTIGMVKEIEDDIQKIVKSTRSKQGENRDAQTTAQHSEASALYTRLKFTRLLFVTLAGLNKREDITSTVGDVKKYLNQCKELLQSMLTSVDLGVQPVPTQDTSSTVTYPTVMGFEPLVNQRLLPPTFPRYTRIRSREETLVYLDKLMSRVEHVCNVVGCSGFHGVLDFMRDFSNRESCVLSRSVLQMLYMPADKMVYAVTPIAEVLRETARNFICPPALMPKSSLANNPLTKEHVDAFIVQATRPFRALLQITGNNRARQRDKLAHVLDELSNLQDEADKVDAFLHNLLIKSEPQRQHLACFGSWVLCHVIQVMIQYLLLGFELELYSPHEYHYIYWYLYEILYGWLISVLSRADGFCVEYDAFVAEQQKGRNKKAKKKKRQRPYARDITVAQAYQNLSGGLYKALAGFQLEGRQKKPMFEFDSEQVRYEHRFGPFGSVNTPPPVPFEQCQALLKVAKTNFVVMKLLASGHKGDSKEPPEFLFTPHKAFPIIRIT